MVNHCQTLICHLNGFLGGLRLFSVIWSENAALFQRLMKLHSNPPTLCYDFKMRDFPIWQLTVYYLIFGWGYKTTQQMTTIWSEHKILLKHSIVQTLRRTVEPRYNEDLGTMKITLYQVSCYIRVKIKRNIKGWGRKNYFVIGGFVLSNLFITGFHCIYM